MRTSSFAFRWCKSLLLPAGLLAIFCSCIPHSAAQEPQSQTPPKKEESAPAPTSTPNVPNAASPAAPDAQKPLTLKQAIQKKKVLTEEDLHPKSARATIPESDQRDFNPICEPACEQRVRDQVAVDEESELEFRNRLAVATQQIDNDRKWGNALVEAVHAADDYCDLERNRGKYAYPGAKPPYTTDKLTFDFISKEREVVNKYVTAKGNVDLPTRAMQYTDSFRAIVMQSMWDAALERSCRGVDHI
ncbi:MAG TPA: hypothetical protein VNK47_11065 [Candidatus Dormibacteraeota bacterium]|nr:hypothetical protein [Candidatus Dormibacteraeota bacterium]